MGIRRTASTVMAILIAIVTLAGCSFDSGEEVAFAEDYLENVLDMDFYGMGEKLWDEGTISDYETETGDTRVMKALLSEGEFEQRGYSSSDGIVSVEYVLKLPDYNKIEGKIFDGYDDFVDFVASLDKTNYRIDITLIKKEDRWRIYDADSTVSLYGEIMDNIRLADVKGALCYNNVSEVVYRYLPALASAIMEADVRHLSNMNEISITEEGVQILIQEYGRENDAASQYAFLVGFWCETEPMRDEHYHGLNANGKASGVVYSGQYVVQVYDVDGRHSDEVCSVLSDLSELV